jgi:hypothetical protein
MRGTTAVLGEEQVVDVELDRGTEFLPVRRDYVQIGARALWDRVGGGVGDGGRKEEGGGELESGRWFLCACWGDVDWDAL